MLLGLLRRCCREVECGELMLCDVMARVEELYWYFENQK